MIFLYPYPHQIFAVAVAAIILFIVSIPVYAIYKRIKRRLREEQMKTLRKGLIIAGIVLGVFLSSGMAVSLVKLSQVNRLLGFRYATPDTKLEGELFLITRIETGKTMNMAGIQKGDRVLMNSVDDLYALLVNNQGNTVEIPIQRDMVNHKISVQVPEMEICQIRFWPFNRY